jgi:hypothetical protein
MDSKTETELKQLEKQIAAAQVEADELQRKKDAALRAIAECSSKRAKILQLLAAGDASAERALDALDCEERSHSRTAAGLDLLLLQKNSTVENLRRSREPLVARFQLDRFHAEARAAAAQAEKSFLELEELLEASAAALARFQIDAARAHEIFGNRAEGVDYRNKVVARSESLPTLMRLKVVNGGWRRPLAGQFFAPAEVAVPAAFPPAN